MTVVLMSLWRNDAPKGLVERATHLLQKTSHEHQIEWLWTVGDSNDETETVLRTIASRQRALGLRVRVTRHDSGLDGSDTPAARRRAAWTASRMFADVPASADFACLHESDLQTEVDIVDRLLANPTPVAGWPVIRMPYRTLFYDTWAYRHLDGTKFEADIERERPFTVSSFGSCWIAPAALVRGRVLDGEAIVGLCKQWRAEGIELWVDPRVIVRQPVELWELR